MPAITTPRAMPPPKDAPLNLDDSGALVVVVDLGVVGVFGDVIGDVEFPGVVVIEAVVTLFVTLLVVMAAVVMLVALFVVIGSVVMLVELLVVMMLVVIAFVVMESVVLLELAVVTAGTVVGFWETVLAPTVVTLPASTS